MIANLLSMVLSTRMLNLNLIYLIERKVRTAANDTHRIYGRSMYAAFLSILYETNIIHAIEINRRMTSKKAKKGL